MLLSLTIIKEKLNITGAQMLSDWNEECYLEGVRIFTSVEEMSQSYLYIASAEEMQDFDEIPDGCSLVLTGKLLSIIPESCRIDILLLPQTSMIEAMNVIQSVFSLYNAWERELMQKLVACAPLQSFIDITDKVIGWPLAIIDRAEGTLAISSIDESDDVIWNAQKRGYIETELLEKDNIKAEHIASKRYPVQLFSELSGRYLLSKALRVKGRVVGFISAHHTKIGNERFSKGVVQLLDAFSKLVEERMDHDELYSLSNVRIFECLFRDLLDGKIVDGEIVQDREGYLDLDTSGKKYILYIKSRDQYMKEDHLRAFLDKMEVRYPNIRGIYYNGKLFVMYFEGKKGKTLKNSAYEEWLIEQNVDFGVSNPFIQLKDTAEYAQQAEKAIYFGSLEEPKKQKYYYCEYSRLHQMEIIAEKVNLMQLLDPLMLSLIEMLPTRPFLFESLKAYLRNERNIAAAAKELFIHKNTMVYRVKLLEDIFGDGFEKREIRDRLILSVDILDYMIRYQGYTPSIYEKNGC